MARCLIGCGANAGVPRDQLERAVELLRFMPGISLVAVSRPHRSAPVGGPAGQPPFRFTIPYRDADLISTGRYAVRATVRQGVQLLFTIDTFTPDLTGGPSHN